jgi:uncharacterized protein DUF6328
MRSDARLQPDEVGMPAGARRETPRERADRNLEELTGELRVVVTGVQVLFGFLLVVPFDSGFSGIGPFERTVYFATLLLSALAAVCMLAPSAYHRVLFQHDDKRYLVRAANRFTMAGLGFLAVAMSGSLLLVAVKLFGIAAGLLVATSIAAVFLTLWFVRPMVRRAGLEAARRRSSS